MYTAPLLEDEGELKMAFKVMTKKGNKQQVGGLSPLTSLLTQHTTFVIDAHEASLATLNRWLL